MEHSLTNLIAAVENGFFSDTTNTRLKELEQRKTELKALIAVEKEKEVQPLTREQVTKYLSYAITQPSQTLINLLVRKAIIKGNTVDIYLKYATDDPPAGSAHAVKYSINPERNLSERGFLFMSYTYSYTVSAKGRHCKISTPKQGKTRYFTVHIFI